MKMLLSIWVSFVMLFVNFVPGFVAPGDPAEVLCDGESMLPEILDEQGAGLFFFSPDLGIFVEKELDLLKSIKLFLN